MRHFLILSLFLLFSTGFLAQEINRKLSSPCPDTFQYQMGPDGVLYGLAAVYSYNEHKVELKVDLSVANKVENYNGEINLVFSKSRTVQDILRGQPVRYKISFPRWNEIPPKVTQIMVNGQVVCRGTPWKLGPIVSVLTTVYLQHTLTLNVAPSRQQPAQTDNPFFRASLDANQRTTGGVNFNPEPPQEEFIVNPFFEYPVVKTTAAPPVKLNTNEIISFSKNPFLNGSFNFPPLKNATLVTSRRDDETTPEVPTTTSTLRPWRSTTATLTRNLSKNDNVCGIPVVPNPLVIKGSSVPRGAFPWLAALFTVTSVGLEYRCGGSLVSTSVVVTAAHCVKDGPRNVPAAKILFVLGKINIQRWSVLEGEKMVEASRVVVHPDYLPNTGDADLAVVTLSEEIVFSKYIRPICLWLDEPAELDLVVGQKGKVVGWGKDEDGNLMTAEPKQTIVPIVSQEQCLRSSETFNFITSNRTFCAGLRDGSGPCNGDSGSGFIMKRSGRWVLRGIVSISTYDHNRQSCDLHNYVVFTDAAKFKTWFLSHVK